MTAMERIEQLEKQLQEHEEMLHWVCARLGFYDLINARAIPPSYPVATNGANQLPTPPQWLPPNPDYISQT